jgi:alpha-galactosidase
MPGDPVLLRGGGTSLLLDPSGPGLPVVVHWGGDLGRLSTDDTRTLCAVAVPGVPSSSIDTPRRVGLLPSAAQAYAGRAAVPGAAFTTTALVADGEQLRLDAVDEHLGLELATEIAICPAGVLTARHTLRNRGPQPYPVTSLPFVLPVPAAAAELVDQTGRHTKERVPQRLPFGFGAWVREQRRGRTGHDAPLLLVAGTPGFDVGHGEVWAVHVAWSGDATTFAERLPEGWSGIGGGELLQPGEVVLAPGEEYAAPRLYFVHADDGLDGVAAALHGHLRARSRHPRTPRPVVLNTWEAVYFDHDQERLRRLADLAAEVGVERFVLDDGWFGSRRDDTSGLGDWEVSAQVWPAGLHPLAEHVVGLGMGFGLWVEPEMVNPDSELARAHPDWILRTPGRTPPAARHQQVLDLARPQVRQYLFDRLDALLREYPISYLKWDHNRDLTDAGCHAQTLAVYALLDDLRLIHPDVEIESCAGGGGRVDLGILQRTDRIWTSDSNDPVERQRIQRWTGLLVPPELMGAHVGPPRAHTTGRTTSLAFRAGTALFGHFGVEWDLLAASAAELGELAAWIDVHRRFRGLLHGGRTVHLDHPGWYVHGVVSPAGDEAMFAVVQPDTLTWALPPSIRLPGLEPDRHYRVLRLQPGAPPVLTGPQPPPWWDTEPVLTGSALGRVGLAAPPLGPEQLVLLHVSACT